MTTKTLTATYPAGYTLSPGYSGLALTASAYVGGVGLLTQAAAVVSNAGVIHAQTTGDAGLSLASGGGLYNTTGTITGAVGGGTGGEGVFAIGDFIVNAGAITGGAGGAGGRNGLAGSGGAGVELTGANTLTNSGEISGGAGGNVAFGAPGGAGAQLLGGGSVVNTGTILAGAIGGGLYGYPNGDGVDLLAGGDLTNGSTLDTSSLIQGGNGVLIIGGAAASVITNYGQIKGFNPGSSSYGVYAYRALSVSVINHGTIHGEGAGFYTRSSPGAVTNLGTISGYAGVRVIGASITVTNAGAIIGTGSNSYSLGFTEASDRLIVDTGASFVGKIRGGGGTLEFGGGADTVNGTGTLSGNASGTFSAFGSYAVDSGASLTVASEAALNLTGAFQNAGTVAADGGAGFGSLVIDGGVTLSGGGIVILNAKGVIEGNAAGAALTNIDNSILGGGFIETPLTLVNEAAGIIDADSGRMLINVAGTVTNAGLIEATGAGILLLSNTTIDSSSGGTVEAGKQIQLNKATLLGGSLSIDKGGSLLSGAFASTINLEGEIVTNAGTLEGAGGGLTVDGDVADSGLVIAETGALTITGAVIGTGRIEVFGKQTLEIDGAQSGTIGFGAGSTGRLVLGDSSEFTGTVTGFSKTGANSIDLKDIDFADVETPVYVANKNPNTGGVLTISDGAHTATLKLAGGNFSGSTFELSADAGTGTIVVDPKLHAFVAAIAGLAPSAVPGVHADVRPHSPGGPVSLAAPPPR